MNAVTVVSTLPSVETAEGSVPCERVRDQRQQSMFGRSLEPCITLLDTLVVPTLQPNGWGNFLCTIPLRRFFFSFFLVEG